MVDSHREPRQHESVDQLLAHTAWIKALASNLVRDPGRADDLTQEAWVVALSRPRGLHSPRGWLTVLLRRQLRQMRRGDTRRSAREALHARPLRQPSTAEVVERAESQRDLVQAVLDLREPYRTTVLLRYLDELTPVEVATRMGVPVHTVHSRLARGLAALRVRFARDEDSRPRLDALLLWTWLGRPRVAARAAAGILGPVALVAVVVGAAWRLLPSVAPVAPSADPHARVESARAPASAETAIDRSAARGALEPEGALDPRARPQTGLHVRVLDREGRPVPGVRVALESPSVEALGTSDAEGSVRLPPPPGPAEVHARDVRFETVLAARALPHRTEPIDLVVAPRCAFGGRVVTSDGTPVANAALTLWIDPYLPVDCLEALAFSVPVRRTVESDRDGRFRFDAAPLLPEAHLEVLAAGFAARTLSSPPQGSDTLEIVLARVAGAQRVRGRVTDAAGRPLADACVGTASAVLRTGPDGDFTLFVEPTLVDPRLVAAHSGCGAAEFVPPLDTGGRAVWPEWVELALRPGAVRGRVLDPRGRPLAGARVWLADATPLGLDARGPRFVEDVAAGRERERSWVESDADGAFELAGLLERPYRLAAADPRTLSRVERDVRAGESVVLALESPPEAALRGCVVDDTGAAQAGVRLTLQRPLVRFATPRGTGAASLALATVESDARGRFELPACVREGVQLRVDSDASLTRVLALEELGEEGETRIVCSRRFLFRVELAQAERADAFEIQDAEDRPLFVSQLRDARSLLFQRVPLRLGRSLVLCAPAEAVWLVLYLDQQEIGRVRLRKDPGGIEVVRG